MAKINMKRKLWAGFTGGHIDIINVDTGWGGFGAGSFAKMPAVFATRKEATKRYQDVRQVEVQITVTT
jgi:hypothetical protein